MPASKKPSKVQLETLKHIKEYIEAHQYSPTVAELAATAGVTPNCVAERLGALVKLKLVTKTPGIARSIRPVYICPLSAICQDIQDRPLL